MDIGTQQGAAGYFFGPVNLGGHGPVDWPYRVGAVPRLAHGRQPRPADAVLAAAVAGGGAAVVCQVLAGMGGVGKTQLAAGLAEQMWDTAQLDLLVWVTATSRETVLDTYAQAAADITGVGDQDLKQATRRLLAWLATTSRRWLFVLDDVIDPRDLVGLWPPETSTGRTVVTTRRRDAALLAGRTVVDVGVFTPSEALAYLNGQLGDSPHRLDEADRLASDLGHLPLALAQAATYIRDQDWTCASYRNRLAKRHLEKLSPPSLPDDQQQAVADTWGLSIERADAETGGLAGIVLQIAALLDPNGIPADVLTTSPAAAHYQERLDRGIDRDDIRDAIRALYRLGLADTTADDTAQLLRVHALVQRVIREATPSNQETALAHTAADALLDLWRPVEQDTAIAGFGQELRANTAALTRVAGSHLWRTPLGEPDAHPIWFRAGRSLGEIGLVTAARDHFEILLADVVAVLGPEHSDALLTRRELARWRGAAEDAAGAAATCEHLLARRTRVLGPDHPYILATRSNLAYWRGVAGEPALAAAAMEQLLADYIRVLGPDDPDTMIARRDLALWRFAVSATEPV